LKSAREAEIIYLRQQNELEVGKTGQLAAIETEKFKDTVNAIGPSTLQAIATAGPDLQVSQMAYYWQ
jgi:major vault protein